ncbi:hypothetical protein D0Y65_052865 [Glycine soja]|uniref:Uncharacterized protein n=1 Tax=Glycine soja TaxID=3848 RepID=A0A445EZR3_GLYSO|nr:hypothetical protein D0Y65_052865 [Glycine soja]
MAIATLSSSLVHRLFSSLLHAGNIVLFTSSHFRVSGSLAQIYMEDGYVRKMSDGVDVEVDMDNDVRIDEDIHKDYGQEIGKIVDCSKTFITTKVHHQTQHLQVQHHQLQHIREFHKSLAPHLQLQVFNVYVHMQ